jgi:inositol 2-dehydrogenase
MSKRIHVGVIGLGRLGSLYAGYFAHRLPKARLVAVSDLNAEAAREQAAELGVARWYQHYQDLLADREVEAVVVVTPTNTHREMVMEAAGRGKAIFCEKPLSISLEEARAIQQAVERAGVFFHMGFMRRFDRGYAAAKRKIEEGVIGDPVVFKSSSRDPYRPSLEYLEPKNSGGLIIDMGIHDVDLGRWLMGEVRSVHSIGGTLAYPEMKEIGDLDNAIVSLSFESGALGVIDLSRNGVYGYDIRTEVLGTRGTLKVGYLRETPLRVMTKDGVTHDTVPYFMERFGQAYVAQLEDFLERLAKGEPPSISCADGVAALQVSVAATSSFKEGRPVALLRTESVDIGHE